jgi:hypothetical protein
MNKLYHEEIGGKDYVFCGTINANLRIAEKYESVQKCFRAIQESEETTEALQHAAMTLIYWYLEEGRRRAEFDNIKRADGTEYEAISLELLGTLITGDELLKYVDVCACAYIGAERHDVNIEDKPKNAARGEPKATNGSSRKQG